MKTLRIILGITLCVLLAVGFTWAQTAQKKEDHAAHQSEMAAAKVKWDALNVYHGALHPIHQAMDKEDYDAVKKNAPRLAEKAAALAKAEIPAALGTPKDAMGKQRDLLVTATVDFALKASTASKEDLKKSFDKTHELMEQLLNALK